VSDDFFAGDADAGHSDDGRAEARPLGDEALRLASSVGDWAQGWAGRNLGDARDGHTGNECHWCPVCQFLAVLRGERPEVTERVAEAGTAVAAALRALVEAASGASGMTAQRRHHERPPASRVQKIKLGDED